MKEGESQRLENVVVARPAAGRNVVSALRSPFNSKSPIDAEFPTSPRNTHNNEMELGIRVCVDRSVMVDYKDESKHTSSWGKPTVN